MVGEGPPRLANMYPLWLQNTNIKWYMDSVKSNLLFSNAGCRISEAYIFRLFKKVPIRAPKAHRGNCQLTYSHFSWTGLFLGGYQNWEHIHIHSPIIYNCPSLNQRKGENWNYFMITFHESYVTGWGSNSWPLYITDKESDKHPTALLDPSWGSNSWPFHYR